MIQEYRKLPLYLDLALLRVIFNFLFSVLEAKDGKVCREIKMSFPFITLSSMENNQRDVNVIPQCYC